MKPQDWDKFLIKMADTYQVKGKPRKVFLERFDYENWKKVILRLKILQEFQVSKPIRSTRIRYTSNSQRINPTVVLSLTPQIQVQASLKSCELGYRKQCILNG
jgi:glutathionyl-hydroquinone reductase